MTIEPKYKFFTDFQNFLYKEHRYTMDKLNPTKNFWWYHPLKRERVFREIGYHSYHIHYADKFETLRNNVKKVLEIGVFRGHSMLMWEKYFPNANIYGVDIDYSPHNFGVNAKDLCKNQERIRLFEMDACNPINVNYLQQELGKNFDVVIDDGSHHPYHQLFSLIYYADFIKPNGYFVVEDIFMSQLFNREFLDYFNEPYKLFHKDKFFFDEIINGKKLDFINNGFTSENEKTFNEIINTWEISVCPPKDYALTFEDVDLQGGNKTTHFNNRQGIIFFKKPNQ